MNEIRPQQGPQELFLSTPADIAIYGGAAGGGKTFALLMEPLRHINNPRFGAVFFRRDMTQITNEGGPWDEAVNMYSAIGGRPVEHPKPQFTFQSGASVSFDHLQLERDIYRWQGAQIPLIMWDELTHFSKKQFRYMMSRNRSVCGVRPYMRATCNPDPDSFVADMLIQGGYIDDNTGYSIDSMSGVIKWLKFDGDQMHWFDNLDDANRILPNTLPKSFTFIPAKLSDNKILMASDPGYLSNLQAQDAVERGRLLDANWKIRPAAGLYFKSSYFEYIDAPPAELKLIVRAWDKAATEVSKKSTDPDYTVGVKLGIDGAGKYYILDAVRFRESPGRTRELIKQTADRDGSSVVVAQWQDPGSAGKSDSQHYATDVLRGYKVKTVVASKSKITYAGPVSSQSEHGNVAIVRGSYVDWLVNEMENFPDGKHDDAVDALSLAFAVCNQPTYSGRAAGSGYREIGGEL